MLSYREALEFIHGMNRFGIKLGLQNITRLLQLLGNPYEGIKIIHVAGTNGKGSTCAMIDSILRAAGYRVGLYTSPYLEVFNERIRVNGRNIPDEDIARLTEKIRKVLREMEARGWGAPTEFEVVTALGFMYFKEQNLDFLVLEVGMGGRYDATNVVTPLVSVITPISYDHQQYLGNTLPEIAREKCGIIKQGVPVVTAPQDQEAMRVIEGACRERNCPLVKVGEETRYRLLDWGLEGQVFSLETARNVYDSLKIKLLGDHQLDNAATAVASVEALGHYGINITKEAVEKGLLEARWPGRLEIIGRNPDVLIDGAHNPSGVRVLKSALLKYFPGKRVILVLGILKDKDYLKMLEEIIPVADAVVATRPDSPRALGACELEGSIRSLQFEKMPEIYSREDVEEAIDTAFNISGGDDVIVFAGSLYMIGKVRSLLRK
ncbi:bifunctional folylpolyglutamate synthase/dihydrofolate synthase [Thermosediminibacter litoriperuensis]|uniref:Dihydrofolate synthase/folylpolyglutamate synthase n=1 Tax=Thermosediminibacter litoriperuensis TaxID=291989 RepID=A0A5S5AWC8_9FIRM|nr:folylpolyglutamate synthase/dihydrofolate synthase family protein [Thermosediminibacter litoriperuensis]TYP57668.1 dihydrofolate synthase/folylpolyglutamate synthase [Thermosediminibacter litoriperuensis]